jgi:hypothetical protein
MVFGFVVQMLKGKKIKGKFLAFRNAIHTQITLRIIFAVGIVAGLVIFGNFLLCGRYIVAFIFLIYVIIAHEFGRFFGDFTLWIIKSKE